MALSAAYKGMLVGSRRQDSSTRPLTGIADLNIISTHLALAHLAIFREGPVLKTVTTLPLHVIVRILVLIPGVVS